VSARAVRATPQAWIMVGFVLLSPALACAPLHIQTRNGIYHPVQPGETLWSICSAYGADMTSVCMFNGISDPDSIRAGERLFIPGARRPLSVGSAGAGKHPEAAAPAAAPPAGGSRKKETTFVWPVKGRVTSGFGLRDGRRHEGIDIEAPRGTPVVAAEAGKVVYSGNGIRGFGNLIIIEHPKQFSTVYAHNEKNLVAVDASVRKGQRIATVGDTGRSQGCHLHFEIRKKVKPMDPMHYLPNPE